ncbi:aminoglycoside phosphotransferase family protein [Saccharibacillus sp. CPCC 101409]|uniref:phosphotransferase family protein n=1 Tax=Saccharibacillus sp. CPCC 101409 TaxID=3058041 RepID=UPI0026722100|nr:aminoglycoside phosphotransferase family protein [Saccharibacillus sp. CPCC 101409]MDO3410135.1 aminoglycoside phosphotransferase family protein [Saccharibacillus sp. CPCC 101409]
MESVTKRKFTEEEIVTIAEAAFGCGPANIEELSEGWANSAYRLDLENGTSAILKAAAESEEGRMRCERGLMKTEVEVMRRIAQLGTVPVPEIYTYDDSKKIVPCEYFLMQRLTGTSYDKVRDTLPEEEREAIDFELGGYFRRIHTIEGDRFGYYLPSGIDSSDWGSGFAALMRDVLQDGRDAGVRLPMPYEALDAELERHRDTLGEVRPPRLIHWDSWPGNVIVKDGRVEGIIDFERALWADPLMEYGFGKFMQSPEFERGYESGGEPSESSAQAEPSGEGDRSLLIRRALYPLYLDLVMCVECAYRGFGPEHTQWAYDNLRQGWERYLDMTGERNV